MCIWALCPITSHVLGGIDPDACCSKRSPSRRGRELHTAGLQYVISAASMASNTEVADSTHRVVKRMAAGCCLSERTLREHCTQHGAQRSSMQKRGLEKCQDMCRYIILECNGSDSLTATILGRVVVFLRGGMRTMTAWVKMALISFQLNSDVSTSMLWEIYQGLMDKRSMVKVRLQNFSAHNSRQ